MICFPFCDYLAIKHDQTSEENAMQMLEKPIEDSKEGWGWERGDFL